MGTTNNPNGNNNTDLGGEYPNRAKAVNPLHDPNMAPVYAGPVTMMTYAGPDAMNGKITKPVSGELKPGDCPTCGSPNQIGAKFCENCGSLLKK